MPEGRPVEPRRFHGVMVSSTFDDLKEHRAALIRAIEGQELKALAMEQDSAKPAGDVIDHSLRKVREGAAYVGVISRRYGQIPECPERNPLGLSLTELEFDEAVGLDRPVLLFLMGEDHSLRERDVESDPEKRTKLEAFRVKAKRLRAESPVQRIYKVFNSGPEFEVAATQAVADLRRLLDKSAEAADSVPDAPIGAAREPDPIPTPPAFYAEPPYIGSHSLVGRRAELDRLDDWAAAADPHPVLLFEAIGGTGKSLLTWEWTTKRATEARPDWAGRFWYSFYERGAVMADFCRRGLAYMTGQPLAELNKKKTPELAELLVHELRARPWLFVLDGLERVLVAYHRIDAAQLADEDVDATKDQIADRNICDAIRPEDDDLLRALAGAAPSKLLVTTRLTPRVLLNPSHQPISGVRREFLPGLRPPDAEAMFRACGVTGESQAIQDFLQRHCDCHPLVIGVVAGLVFDYLPDRGNFDTWVLDPEGGGRLNLAELDLVRKRNHILHVALAALPDAGRQLLSTLAILSEAADYEMLKALNPHLPPEPAEVPEPDKAEGHLRWDERAVEARLSSQEYRAAPKKLAETVSDLERRGLLQYDAHKRRHDLHPVVRGVAAGRLRREERERFGQRVVDHFSRREHDPYEEAEDLDDVRDGLRVVRALLQMGRFGQALSDYRGGLSNALTFNFEAHSEILALLKPFFPDGWSSPPVGLDDERDVSYLLNEAGIALRFTGQRETALVAYGAKIRLNAGQGDWSKLCFGLTNICIVLVDQNHLAGNKRQCILALELATLLDDPQVLFKARLDRFTQHARAGRWAEAEALWRVLDSMGRNWARAIYRPGDAEWWYALCRFWQGMLEELHLAHAEVLARQGKNRSSLRALFSLRGGWRLLQGEWALAAESFHEAVRMAREVGQTDSTSEAGLSLARFHLGQLSEPQQEAERLAQAKEPADRLLAELWLALGDRDLASKHALAAHRWAWADGEPYVWRYELDQSRALLERLGVPIPDLPPYDPAKDPKFPWEAEVEAAIEKLRAEKEAEEAKEAEEPAAD